MKEVAHTRYPAKFGSKSVAKLFFANGIEMIK
jgi:hypothetical protein